MIQTRPHVLQETLEISHDAYMEWTLYMAADRMGIFHHFFYEDHRDEYLGSVVNGVMDPPAWWQMA